MALAKCPKCSHTVLSVASQCPKCFVPLNESVALADRDVLADCRGCGRAVYSHISTCPHCGARRPAMRRRGLLIAGMIVLVIVCLTILALLRQPEVDHVVARGPARQPKTVLSTGLRTVDGPLRVRPSARAGQPDTTPVGSPAATDSAISRAREALAVANQQPVEAPAASAAKSRRPVRAPASQTSVVRVVATWANVRGDSTNDSQVVRILRPGTEVAVVPQQERWWPVLENGRQVGYVARALLKNRVAQQ
jgi:hypothetical protein